MLTSIRPPAKPLASQALVRLLLLVLAFGVAPRGADAGDSDAVHWQESRSEAGHLRRAVFPVLDSACAYTVMAEPVTMGRLLRHVKKLVVHKPGQHFQDISVHERFFLVGNVESRYHRNLNGRDRLEWKLISGRQARHDGFWQVEARDDGGYQVTFENLIAAKYAIHQGLLRRIQVRTMRDIVESVIERCGSGVQQPQPAKGVSEPLVETDTQGRANVRAPAAGSSASDRAGAQSR